MHRHGIRKVNHNAQKHAVALLPLFFLPAFEYAIRKIRGKAGGTETEWEILDFGLLLVLQVYDAKT
jgi:hypothetical protein